jgi:hypothetical protein
VVEPIETGEVFGLIRTSTDVHTLGLSHFSELLSDCGISSVLSDATIAEAAAYPENKEHQEMLFFWIQKNRITRLGFSYRLDPDDGKHNFAKLLYFLKANRLLSSLGGPIKALYFAGLPRACKVVADSFGPDIVLFQGDETPAETLAIAGVPHNRIPSYLKESSAYDDVRMSFGKDLVRSGSYLSVSPYDRSGYTAFGGKKDSLETRLEHARQRAELPLFRAHVGPFDPDRVRAVTLFKSWLHDLAETGFLDIVSIGTSQLTQEKFGEEWGELHNGGGVPLNSPQEFREVWEAARPMLMRTYAGTKGVPSLAHMYEETINIAWHALSFWWFCRIDGRGPNSVFANLREHFQTLSYIAKTGKPFEANVPHHFAFRGADDVTFILSAYLAAKAAKQRGVRLFVLQIMFNTPKNTWGIQDLAKARAMLRLVRELEDNTFRVLLQPRAGLDYFSPDEKKAKAQLASVTAMMDDIEPGNIGSPQIIHVVSYSEALHLAEPKTVDESIQITREALKRYRIMRKKGDMPDMSGNASVNERTDVLFHEAKQLIDIIEHELESPYSPEGFYKIFTAGFLPVPYLWEGREEFAAAAAWKTRLVNGGMTVVNETGLPVAARYRGEIAASHLRTIRLPLA